MPNSIAKVCVFLMRAVEEYHMQTLSRRVFSIYKLQGIMIDAGMVLTQVWYRDDGHT